MKRTISLFLSICMLLTAAPVPLYATEELPPVTLETPADNVDGLPSESAVQEEPTDVEEEPTDAGEPLLPEGDLADTSVVASGSCGDSATWTLDDTGALTISGSGSVTSTAWYSFADHITEVHIAAEVSGMDVSFSGEYPLLATFTVESGNPALYSLDGVLFAKNGSQTSLLRYPPAKQDSVYSIPEGVRQLEHYAFWDCVHLQQLTFPASLSSIGVVHFSSPFAGCTALERIQVADGNQVYTSDNGVLFEDGLLLYYPGGNTETFYAIPSGTPRLGFEQFGYCPALTELRIPSSVMYFDSWAFGNLPNLQTIIYEGTETAWNMLIDPDTLAEYTSATVTFENNSTVSGKCGDTTVYTLDLSSGVLTFSGSGYVDGIPVLGGGVTCLGFGEAIKTAIIGEDITNIHSFIFSNCSSLTTFIVDPANTDFSVIDGVLMSADGTSLEAYPYGSTDSSYTVPEGVTSIAPYAFNGAAHLQSVSLPATLKRIWHSAFYECDNLTSVFYAGNEALWSNVSVDSGNTPLLNATFTYGTANILSGTCGDSASWSFNADTGALTVSGSGKTGNPWYYLNDRITSITIGAGITSFPLADPYPQLEWVTVEAGNTTLSSIDGVLYNGSTIQIYPAQKPDTVFRIPDNVERISSAFRSCAFLQEVIIPASVHTVDSLSFYDTPMLSAITVDPENPWFSSENGVLMSADQTQLVAYPGGKADTSYTVPDGVTDINGFAFFGANNLQTISLPTSLIRIAYAAFSECDALTAVTYAGTESLWAWVSVDTSNEALQNASFTYGTVSTVSGACNDTVSYTFDTATGQLTISGTGTFSNSPWYKYREGVVSVVFGAGITGFDWHSFNDDYPLLQTFLVESGSDELYSQDGVLFAYNGDEPMLLRYPPAKTDTVYAVPEGIERISSGAFYNCAYLQQLVIPASVWEIEYYAICDCNELESITVAEGNDTYSSDNGVLLQNGTLYHYPAKKAEASYSIPNGTGYLINEHFGLCTALTELRIPLSVTGIELWMFRRLPNLQSIIYEGTADNWNTVLEGETLSDYTSATVTFKNGTLMTGSCGDNATYTLDLAAGELVISGTGEITGEPWYSYRNSITSVTFGVGITDIEWGFFEDDYPQLQSFTALGSPRNFFTQDGVLFLYNEPPSVMRYPAAKADRSYAIPEGVWQIQSYAFRGCSYLQELTIPASVSNISSDAFYNCSTLTAITVADGNDTYASDNGVLLENGRLLYYPGGKTETVYTIPNGTTAVDSSQFGKCTALTELRIPLTVGSLDLWVFKMLPNLQSIVYAGTQESWNDLLEGETLSDYTSATVTFGNSTIMTGSCGDNATYTLDLTTGELVISGTGRVTDNTWYNFNEHITSVTIGADISSISWYLFEEDYPHLQSFTVESGNAALYSRDGVLFVYNGDEPMLLRYPSAKTAPSYVVPEGVRQIWEFAFYNCSHLQELTIPASVSDITSAAFYNCNALTAITVSTDNETFSSDNGILLKEGTLLYYPGGKTETAYAVPNGTTSVRYNQFGRGTALTELKLPLTVSSLELEVFERLPNLQSIIYAGTEDSWKVLLNGNRLSDYTDATVTFENNTILTGSCGVNASYTLDLTTGVLTISGTGEVERVEFSAMESFIQTLVIQEGITSIGNAAFFYLENLTSLSIADSVTVIHSQAFQGCSLLSGLTLPSRLETIDSHAFSDCHALQSVFIPASVTYIAEDVFYDCYSLTAFTVDSANEDYCAVDGALMDADQTVLIAYPCGSSSTAYTVPEGISCINAYAFNGAAKLQSVSLPASLTAIEYAAFYNCDVLSEISYAGTEALWNNVSVAEANGPLLAADFTFGEISTLSGNCGSNAYYTFDPSTGALVILGTGEATYSAWSNYRNSIISVTIGAQIADISWNLFNSDYPNLQSFTVESGNQAVYSQDGVLFACNGDWSTLLRYPSAKEGTSYTIPAGTNQISRYAFNGCALTELALPACCIAGGDDFDNCLTLQRFTVYGEPEDEQDYSFTVDGVLYRFMYGQVYLMRCPRNRFATATAFVVPDNVTQFDYHAFAYCTNLTAVTLPETMSIIPDYAFYKCTDLTTVTLPSSVTLIEDDAFYSGKNSSLTDVYYAGSTIMWNNINIGSGNTCLTSATIHYGDETVFSGTLDDGRVSWVLDPVTGVMTVSGSGEMTGDSRWAGMSCLKKLVVDEGITAVSMYMLSGSSLEELIIPASVTSLQNLSDPLPCLKTITVSEANEKYCVVDNALFSKDQKTLYRFPAASEATSFTVPKSVTRIGSGAFCGCANLETVTVDGPISYITNRVFCDCQALTQVALPGTVKNIYSQGFYNCPKLETVTFAGEEWMWEQVDISSGNDVLLSVSVVCTGLGTLTGTCGPNLTWTLVGSTGELTISGTGDMYDYDSSGNNTGVASPTDLMVYSSEDTGETWHKYAKAVRRVTVTKGVTSISNYAFFGCSSMTQVSLPSGITAIGLYAFYDCRSLEVIHIPASVTYIGSTAFSNCTALTAITMDSANKHYCTVDGILMNAEQTELLCYPGGRENTSYTVPNGVSCIGDYAFYAATRLESISLPASLTRIYYAAFNGCDNLSSVTYAGTKALWDLVYVSSDNNCLLEAAFTYGTESTLSGSCGEGTFWSFNADTGALTITGNGAIEDLPWPIQYIRTVTIGAGITGIHHRTSSYPLLESVTVEAGNPYLYSIDGVLYEGNRLLRYPAQKQDTTFSVPEAVTVIDFGSFNDCAYLQQLNIPASVQAISSNAFSDCSVLTQITVAAGNAVYTSVDGVLLENGKLLYYPVGKTATSYAIPSGTTSLDSEQFGHCTALTELHIPFSVGHLYPGVFRNMPNLERIVYEGGTTTWDALLEDWDLEDYTDAEVVCTNTAVITGTCGTNLTWTLDSATGTLRISGTGALYGYDANNAPWNNYRSMVLSIVIDEGVTSIGQSAFAACYNAASVTIPASVTAIGPGAFAGLSALPGFTVVSSNTTYKATDGILFSADGKTLAAFPGGYPSTSYAIPDTVTQIASYAFKGCTQLEEITIPASVTTIGEGAFFQCHALTHLTLPNSVTAINYATFYNCSSLTEVNIPETVTSIGSMAFMYCFDLSTVELPSGVTEIADAAFLNCSSLTGITLPEKLTAIGSQTFESSGLTSIVIPDSVTEIGSRAFACSSLQTISLPSEIEEIQYSTFYGCRSLTSITIPDKVTIIEQQAFDGCTALTSVTIPLCLSEIDWDAFDGCSALATVSYAGNTTDWNNIYIAEGNDLLLRAYLMSNPLSGTCGDDLTWHLDSSGVLTISGTGDMDDFESCGAPWYNFRDMINTIVVEAGVNSIGQCAFQRCCNATSITLPGSVTSIGLRAFSGCSSITGFTLNSGNTAYQVLDGVLLTADGKTLVAYPNGNSAAAYTVPDSVTAIEAYAFEHCSNLQEIALPNALTNIGDGAFSECSALTSMDIPGTVTAINYATFFNCDSLKSVSIPETVTAIGDQAFQSCNELAGLTIPDTVTAIGDSAFYYCSSLTDIILPEKLTTIGNYAFEDSGLRTIDIPNHVTRIGDYAFVGTALQTAKIPASTTSIGYSAFGWCYYLTGIYVADGNPIYYDDDGVLIQRRTASASAVQAVQVISSGDDLKLYVPEESAEAPADILLVYPSARSAKEYTVPDNVVAIDDSAFNGCPALEKVKIGANTTDLYLNSCDGLTAIEVDEDNPVLYSADGVLYCRLNDTQSKLLCYPKEKPDVAFTIPDNVTCAIFSYPEHLSDLSVPLGMQYIMPRLLSDTAIHYAGSETLWDLINHSWTEASVHCAGTGDTLSGTFGEGFTWLFDAQTGTLTLSGIGDTGDFFPADIPQFGGINSPPWCQLFGISHIVIEEGITRLGNFAFAEVNGVQSISFPSTLTGIGEYLDTRWWLDSIEIPAGVTNLFGNTFGTFKDITLASGNTAFVLEDGVLFTADKKTLVAFYRRDSGSYTVPDGVETIGAYAFYRSALCEILLPDSVSAIEEYAFYGCDRLLTLTLPEGVTSIGIGALLNTGLTTLTAENSTMRPDAYWFVTQIGSTKLQTIYFSGTEAQWSAASAGLSDYYPGVVVICSGDAEELRYSFDSDANTLYLSGADAGTSTVAVAFYDKFGQMVLVKTYSAAELAEGTTITDETLDLSQHTITIFQLDASSAPVTEAIPVNTPIFN